MACIALTGFTWEENLIIGGDNLGEGETEVRTYLRAKVEGVITGLNLDYSGSLTLGEDYGGDFEEKEQVDVLNINNGERFTTYIIKGKGLEIILNGAAARKGMVGDRVIILAYEGKN